MSPRDFPDFTGPVRSPHLTRWRNPVGNLIDIYNSHINRQARFKGDEEGNPLIFMSGMDEMQRSTAIGFCLTRAPGFKYISVFLPERRHSVHMKAGIKAEKVIDTNFKVLTHLGRWICLYSICFGCYRTPFHFFLVES